MTECRALPPLSILHLLVWTAAVAAMMALLRSAGARIDANTWVMTAYLFAMAVYGGTAISGLLMWIANRRRGIPFPTEPGEWLWVTQGALTPLAIGTCFIWMHSEGASPWLLISLVVSYAIVLIQPVRYRRDDTWRAVLLLSAASLLSVPVFSFMLIPLSLVLLATMLAAVLQDRSRGIRRGWMHWIGVGSLIGLIVLLWIALIALMIALANL